METSSSRLRKLCLRTFSLFIIILLASCGGPSGDGPSPEEGLPGYFTLNVGQVGDPEVVLYHGSSTLLAGFSRDGVTLKMVEPTSPEEEDPSAAGEEDLHGQENRPLRGVAVGLTFPGSNRVTPEGRGDLPFPTHFLLGDDPGAWRTDVPSFREVVYPDLYDGIDLVYRAGPGGLKYEFHVRPGGDPSRIEVAYEGIQGIEISPTGDLVVRTALGDLRDSAPVSYHSREAEAVRLDLAASAGEGEEVRSAYVVRSSSSFGFQVEGWDGESLLVIDPLVYSSHLGGLWNDYVRSIAVDPDGFSYLAGWTVSADFPTTRGAFDESFSGSQEAFVVKMRSNGRGIAWATYLGGTGQDDAYSVQVDANRLVYVGGHTRSWDFPVTDGSGHGGGRFDAWLAKLSFDGSTLLHSGYVGGESDDFGYSIAIDGAGHGYVAGFTRSTMAPTLPGAVQPFHMGGTYDAFVAKVDTRRGGLVYFTYLGGSSVDYGWAVAADSAGSAYLTGSTLSVDFPVTLGSLDTDYNRGQDAFVAKISPDGRTLVYSAYLGGGGFERGYSIAVDPFGSAHVAGATGSPDFPVTPGAQDEVYGGGHDGFVAKVDPSGSALAYATYLGGTDRDLALGIAVDSLGDTLVTGFTRSADFPVTPGAFDLSHNGGDDAFLLRLSLDGAALEESTFLGGSGLDRGFAVASRPGERQVYAAGETRSTDFPTTTRAFDSQQSGNRDGFVVKFRY